jgi:hypothetical protein
MKNERDLRIFEKIGEIESVIRFFVTASLTGTHMIFFFFVL